MHISLDRGTVYSNDLLPQVGQVLQDLCAHPFVTCQRWGDSHPPPPSLCTSGSFPPPSGIDDGVFTENPFSGDYKGATWNTQALFAAKCHRQFKKRKVAMKLIQDHDFVCFQETHSQEGSARALTLPDDCVAIWSNGTTRQAGVGIVIKHSFLKLFNDINIGRDVEVIEPGRVFILHLQGPLGNLDVNCSYFDAGSHQLRLTAIRKLGRAIRPHENTLTILLGDWNHVNDKEGRWSGTSNAFETNGDLQEADLFEELILKPHNMHEAEQEHYTCEVKGPEGHKTLSKIDRVYSNQHVSCQLDRCCKTYAREWNTELSTHRPLSTSRMKSEGHDLTNAPMKTWVFKHEHFSERFQVQFEEDCRTFEGRLNPITKLLVAKEAIKKVHDHIVESRIKVNADATEDKLGWAILCARHLERRSFYRVHMAMECFPRLKKCGKPEAKPSEYLNNRELARHIEAVRDLIVELARDDIGEDIEALRTSHDKDEVGKTQLKEHILRKLKRITPGEASQITHMMDAQGNCLGDPRDMAKILAEHWKGVFSKTTCDDAKLREWMDKLFPRNEDGHSWDTGLAPPLPSAWQVTKKHVKKAIQCAKNSMPGPDGIPSSAYRAIGDSAINILHEAFEALSKEDAEETLNEAYKSMTLSEIHQFNHSILCCLPKKPSGQTAAGETYYKAEATRPLNISNVDNRLLTSAARMAWEPILEKWVSDMQRGFLKGRSMLHNLIDIDFVSMKVSLKCEHGALLLFDFKAAFPSVAHVFLKKLFALPWPS